MSNGNSKDPKARGRFPLAASAVRFFRHPLVLALSLVVLTALTANFLAAYTKAQRASGNNSKASAGDAQKISPEASRQIDALLREKDSRTPVQTKIDSQLIYQSKMARGESVADGVPSLTTGLATDAKGRVEVDIRADVSAPLLEALKKMGVEVFNSSAEYHTVAARVNLDQVEKIAALDQVSFIQPNFQGNVWKGDPRPTSESDVPFSGKVPTLNNIRQQSDTRPSAIQEKLSPAFNERAARVKQYLMSELSVQSGSGSVVSQGDTTHRANDVKNWLNPHVDGTGIKIGVLSNGVASLAASQALGDLGQVTVLSGQTGSGDEGTAMLEIIHDLAPGAQLYFATANPTPAQFATNIRNLRAAGCDIIVDDVFYFVETPFQDGQAPTITSNTNGGLVIQAVADVTADGAMYFSSAGNQGNQDDSTASCFQGDWVDGGTLAVVSATNHVQDFGGGAQSNLIQTGSGNPINMYWSDPLGGSANDYDIFVLNNALTTVVASATNVQNGTQDPEEQVASSSNVTNNRIVVVQKAGAAARFIHITINANGVGKLGVSTNGTTKGHSIATAAYSVAATPAVGPFPNVFTTANVSETFTSDGPRRIFYNADSSPITAGDFSSTGGLVRQKPDITAADGVAVTGVGGFGSPFFGTSAAAPHAGAIAALLKSAYPSSTNAEIRTALTSTALDIEAPGVDRNTGVGIIMAFQSLAKLGPARATMDKGPTATAEVPGFSDGDGRLEKGERGSLTAPVLSNIGTLGATNVQAVLSSNTPGVSVLTGGSGSPVSYGSIAAGGSANGAAPFTFQLGPTFSCSGTIDLLLTVTFTDTDARVETISVPISTAATLSIPSTLIDATAPVATPPFTVATATQTNRVSRSGVASTCAAAKAFPGTLTAASPHYDSYVFTAQSSGCTTVTLTGNTTAASFAVVYTGTFDPANIGTNYLADIGASPSLGNSLSMGFIAVAGQQYTIVYSEVSPNTAPGYSGSVAGPGITSCDFVPTAGPTVTLSGRVATAAGSGIGGAVVTLSGPSFNQTARTTGFGYYSFANVPSGQTYTVSVTSRAYTFTSKTFSLDDNFAALNFTAGQ